MDRWRLDERISIRIHYNSTNRINYIEGNGTNFEEALTDLLNSLFDLEKEFKTNNYATGGYTVFCKDVENVINDKENYINQIKNMIGEDVVNDFKEEYEKVRKENELCQNIG